MPMASATSARQQRLLLLHPAIAHGLVLRRVGPDLGAVQGHMPQLHQPCLPAQLQHLVEQTGQGCQVILAKVGDGAEVGVVVGRQHPEGDVLVEPLGHAPGRHHPGAVPVEQHLHHHPGMIGRAAPLLTLVAGGDGREVQLVQHVVDEISQMVLGQPLLQSRRQQQLLVGIVGTEGLARQPLHALDSPPIITATVPSMVFLGRGARGCCLLALTAAGRSRAVRSATLGHSAGSPEAGDGCA